MESKSFNKLALTQFTWLNEPQKWKLSDDKTSLEVTTDNRCDFWQGTRNNNYFNTGHLYGVQIKDDFTFSACIEAEYSEQYDQAGLMIYQDEKHWLKAGIEYVDGLPTIGSVLTNGLSDWGTGIFTGNPKKVYLRLTKKDNVVCVKYSTDNIKWTTVRLCPFESESVVVGLMTCTPKRAGLQVKFSEVSVCDPPKDVLHSN